MTRTIREGQEERRIGIFEYDWSLYSFLKDLAIKLGEAGFKVDIFQKNPGLRLNFTDPGQFASCRNIRYFSFDTSGMIARKIMQKYHGLLRRLGLNVKQNLMSIIDHEILLNSKEIVDESRYQCFIGVEKKGLVWAGILSQIYGCPLVYYSLELYLEDHPGLAALLATKEYSYLRMMEKKYHRLSSATIIQDSLRAGALLKYNEVESTNIIYLPISVRGDIVEKKANYFSGKVHMNTEKKFILYFGQIQEQRFSTELVGIGSHLTGDNVLVMHGFGDPAYLTYLKSISDPDRVVFSLDLVSEDQILNVISSATIGLALYENNNSNDRFAAFSSVKLAYYMQCGVPVIAFDSESFRILMREYKCGELINSVDEIPLKVEKILHDYSSYQKQAFAAFKRYYDFDENFKRFYRDFDTFLMKPSLSKGVN